MSQQTPLYDVAAEVGAVWAEEAGWLVAAHFGDAGAEYDAACTAAALFDLSHHGKVTIAGPEAQSFLHNLCSNEVRSLAPGHGCEAFLLTAKARVVAHILVYHVTTSEPPTTLWLDAGPGGGEKVLKHLDHFLISEQVELADHSTDYSQMYLAGPAARSVLEKTLGQPLPDLKPLQDLLGDIAGEARCQIRRHEPLGLPGYDLVCPAAGAAPIWNLLRQAGARLAGRDAHEILRVEAGTPLYGIDIDETHLAMETGRTAQAISFAKGCYLGQEPVVRSRDLGHVNRSLLGLKIAGSKAVPPGSKLFRAAEEVGYITSCVQSPRYGVIALGYVRRGSQQPGMVLEVDSAGTRRSTEVSALPFAGSGCAG